MPREAKVLFFYTSTIILLLKLVVIISSNYMTNAESEQSYGGETNEFRIAEAIHLLSIQL